MGKFVSESNALNASDVPNVWIGHWDIPEGWLNLSESDPLNTDSNREICQLFVKSWVALLNDSPHKSANARPWRVVDRHLKVIRSDGLQVVIKRFAGLADVLMRSASLTSDTLPQGEWIPEFEDTPIMREYITWYSTGDPELYAWILSFLVFGKKLDVDDPMLAEAAFRSWVKVEERLSQLQLDSNLTKGLASVLSVFLRDDGTVPWRFHHGNRAVAERRVWGSVAKTSILGYHPSLEFVTLPSLALTDSDVERIAAEYFGTLPDPAKQSMDVALFRLVAKDQSKYRAICMEPASFMAAQQGVRHWLDDKIRKGYCRRFIKLSDQSYNRSLAAYGSETGQIDTIDLSSASDSVSWDLVCAIFPSYVLRYLQATRTSRVDTGAFGGIVDVKKFAPMGSAVCFPVQCLVFSAVAIYALIHHRFGHPAGSYMDADHITEDVVIRALNSLSPVTSPYYADQYEPLGVFGDDIACDSRLTPLIVSVLTALGFEINISKSFQGGSAFRESCGGWFLRGVDVTPLLFRVKRYTGIGTPEHVASCAAGANNAFDRGYRCYRRVLVRHILRVEIEGKTFKGLNPILFVKGDTVGLSLKSKSVSINDHLTWRHWIRTDSLLDIDAKISMASSLQVSCVRALRLTRADTVDYYDPRKHGDIESADEKYSRHEAYRLYLYWCECITRTNAIDEDNDPPQSFDTRGSRLALGWTPEPV